MRKAVAKFVPPLAELELVPGQLQIFDFSERKQSNRAASFVPGSDVFGSVAAGEGLLLVTRVGDALQAADAPPACPRPRPRPEDSVYVLDRACRCSSDSKSAASACVPTDSAGVVHLTSESLTYVAFTADAPKRHR